MVTLIPGEAIAVARRGVPTSVRWIPLMLKSWERKNPLIDLWWQQDHSPIAIMVFVTFPTFQAWTSWYFTYELQGVELPCHNRKSFQGPQLSCRHDYIAHTRDGVLGTSWNFSQRESTASGKTFAHCHIVPLILSSSETAKGGATLKYLVI